MTHDCRSHRDAVDRDPAASAPVDCAACDAYRRRRIAVRDALARPGREVTPDPGFAARVRARIEPGSREILGLAAARLLPVGLLLAAILVLAVWVTEPSTSRVAEESTDVLEWLLDG